jgi:hypothetical protein
MSRTNQYPYERNILHPAIKRWLEANGFKFKYEKCLVSGNKPDFVATSSRREKFVVEAKWNLNDGTNAAIRQVLGYAETLPGHQPVIAVPQGITTQARIDRVTSAGILFWEFDVQQESQAVEAEIKRARRRQQLLSLHFEEIEPENTINKIEQQVAETINTIMYDQFVTLVDVALAALAQNLNWTPSQCEAARSAALQICDPDRSGSREE